MTSLNHWRLLPLILTGILTLWAGLFAFRDAFAVDPNEVQTTKNIRDLINQGKPRSAIKALTPLIEQAKAQNNADQWIWGTVQRANLQASLTDQPLVESIRNLDQQLETAPKVFQPVLEAILAKSYHSYFQNNRWRFANRTAIDGDADNKDFTEWSLRRILDRIDNGYQAALAEREILNQPISKFEELLVAPKDESDDSSAVSTLLDVIAISALDFYNAGEQANSMAQDPIVIKAEDPVLGTINEFINWEINEKHFGEPAVRAIDLLQRMLAWHRDKNNIEALAYWDQERFQFAKNKVTLGSTDERLVAAGKRHLQRFAGNSIAARMASILAKYHREQNRLKTAHDLATQTLRDYPGTPGANACHNLIAQIEQVQYQLNIESIWGEKLPPLKVKSYRNLGELNFRLYSDDFRRFTSYNPRGDHELFDNRKRQQFLSREPLASWSASLDPTPDFQPKSAELDIREKLKRLPLGGYFLVACDEPSFTKGRIDVTPILRTNLMLVGVSTNRNNQNSRVIGGYVVKGVSGEPLAGVQVDLMMPTEGTGRQMSRKARTTTDSNGQYRFPRGVGQYETYRIVASLKNDRIISPRQSLYGNSPPPIDERSKAGVAYTDRAIYRPGQSLQVAGVVYRADTIKNDYGIVPGVPVKIQLRDANNQEVRSEVVQTNDYGSWSTRFELPAQGVTGRFSILVSSDGQTLTQASVRVEEYKRPTFKIELESAEDDARLSEPVTIRGSAKAYTGASLDDAIVRYRVIRRGRHAPWWFARCYWLPYRPIADQEILVGETKTDSVGNFYITFDADPDPSVDPESEPTFTFEVIADVTDPAGETRSSKTQVPLRFNPIQSRINVDANATDDNSLSVRVNVSGMSSEQTETGTLVVYRHSPPAEVDRFEKQDSENHQPLSPTTWPKVEVMRKEATVESGQEPSFDLDLKAGDYSIEWQVIRDGETLSSAFATSTIWPTRESIPEFSFGLPIRVWL
ncbi:MAG: MG2 domain-containing protein, partial [Planctomycetota bacterium]